MPIDPVLGATSQECELTRSTTYGNFVSRLILRVNGEIAKSPDERLQRWLKIKLEALDKDKNLSRKIRVRIFGREQVETKGNEPCETALKSSN